MQRYFNIPTAIAFLGITSCDLKENAAVIQVEDKDLTIERDGRPIVKIHPYGNGTSIKILSADGEWIEMRPTSPTGKFEDSVFMERIDPDGTTFFLEILRDGTAINRSKFPIGTWPGDDGYEEQPKAEGGAGQPATRSKSGSEGGDNPQHESEGRSR